MLILVDGRFTTRCSRSSTSRADGQELSFRALVGVSLFCKSDGLLLGHDAAFAPRAIENGVVLASFARNSNATVMTSALTRRHR